MQQLKKIVLTQRSLFSSKSLVERIPKILNDVLSSSRLAKKLAASKCDLNSNVKAQNRGTSSSHDDCFHVNADSTNRIRTNKKDLISHSSEEVTEMKEKVKVCRITMDNLFIVRIAPRLLNLLRRVQRFEQVIADSKRH